MCRRRLRHPRARPRRLFRLPRTSMAAKCLRPTRPCPTSAGWCLWNCRPTRSIGSDDDGQSISPAREPYFDRRTALERLVDHAVALGEFQELIELFLWRVGVEIEGEP